MVPSKRGRRFYCVNDDVPAETTALLRQSCSKRGVRYLEVETSLFDFDPAHRLKAGDILYRPAVSLASQRVEQFLFSEGVHTFYSNPSIIYYDCLSSTLVFERAGLPVPPTFYCGANKRAVLRNFVERLGGFPVIVKAPGWSGGIGVMRADSFPSLFSLVDYLLAQRCNPMICAYIAQATHWRLVVIGQRVVAWYRNPVAPDDFRSYATDKRTDYPARIDRKMAEVAVEAVRVLHYEFGGVDILQAPDGKIYLLEANFPCYFPQAEKIAGIDISGMMIDYLLGKGVPSSGGK